MKQGRKKYLISLVGPTAVGKTEMAIRLALHWQTVILSSDSRQFYRELSIGTAKPTPKELNQVKHYFINSLSVNDTYSAGDFERDAMNLLQHLFATHDVVVLAGGSGLYVKALLEGLDVDPGRNEQLRKELKSLYDEKGIEGLQKRLKQTPDAFIQPTEMQNPQRIMRAIERALMTNEGQTYARLERPFRVIQIGLNLPREALYRRIELRVDLMFEQGLLEEAKSMLPFRHSYALQTVGYKELFEFLDGHISLETAKSLIKQHTRNYAKRQLTWFNRNSAIHWFEPGMFHEIIADIERQMQDNSN